jgi:hypothetical protein
MSDFGNIFGNALRFTKFNIGDQWGKIKKNPERVFTGAMDPFSTKVWNKAFDWTAPITGIHKHYDNSMVDQFGGPPPDTYQKAQEQGIPTAQAKTANAIAKAVVAAYAGGAAYNAAGGAAGGEGAMTTSDIINNGGAFTPTEGSSFTVDPSGSYTTAYPSNIPSPTNGGGNFTTTDPNSFGDGYGPKGFEDGPASGNSLSSLGKNQLLSQALKGMGGGQKQQQQPLIQIIPEQPAFMQAPNTLPIQDTSQASGNPYIVFGNQNNNALASALRNS